VLSGYVGTYFLPFTSPSTYAPGHVDSPASGHISFLSTTLVHNADRTESYPCPLLVQGETDYHYVLRLSLFGLLRCGSIPSFHMPYYYYYI